MITNNIFDIMFLNSKSYDLKQGKKHDKLNKWYFFPKKNKVKSISYSFKKPPVNLVKVEFE